MKYGPGAKFFYCALADHLLIEVGNRRSIQLIAPEDMSPPEEDCLALARALAARHQDSPDDPLEFDGETVDPAVLPNTPHILDCRHVDHDIHERFRSHLKDRADVVILVTAEAALLGCRTVSFDRNSVAVFDAITHAFRELLRLVNFGAPALEMPARFLTLGLRGVQAEFQIFEESAHRAPLTSEEIERFCLSICRNWTYCGSPVSNSAVRNWVLQFEPHGVLQQALSLLEFLNRDGFVPKGQIINWLLDLYANLAEESESRLQPISIQPIGKSESMLFYDLRDVCPNPVSFLAEIAKPNAADHLVCFDDVVGSGNTILDYLFAGPSTTDADNLSRWLNGEGHQITILVAIASESGIDAIEQDARCLGRVKVRAARILAQADSIFSPDRGVFRNTECGDKFRSTCEKIGEQLFCWGPLGWNDCQWCVVTDYNVPDCSLPVLWAPGTEDLPWIPLFPRR